MNMYSCPHCNSQWTDPAPSKDCPLCERSLTDLPESKAGFEFDQLVQGIIDGEIMTCLSPAHRSALRKQFERDRQEIERLEESTFFYRREFESATERVNYRDEELTTLRQELELARGNIPPNCEVVMKFAYDNVKKELELTRAKAERLEAALDHIANRTVDGPDAWSIARQALEGK